MGAGVESIYDPLNGQLGRNLGLLRTRSPELSDDLWQGICRGGVLQSTKSLFMNINKKFYSCFFRFFYAGLRNEPLVQIPFCCYNPGLNNRDCPMALAPQKFQEIVFQILFSAEFCPGSEEETALMLMGELKVTKRSVIAAKEKVSQIYAKLDEIDRKIQEGAPGYQLQRVSSAEKCALRLGIFELLYEAVLSPKIVIAEAIRLTRKFGTPESSQFVHAVLDRTQKERLLQESAL